MVIAPAFPVAMVLRLGGQDSALAGEAESPTSRVIEPAFPLALVNDETCEPSVSARLFADRQRNVARIARAEGLGADAGVVQ